MPEISQMPPITFGADIATPRHYAAEISWLI
jgi:hypothetical protein